MNDNNFVDEMVKLDKSLNPAKNSPGDWQKMMDYLRENTMQDNRNNQNNRNSRNNRNNQNNQIW